MLLAVLVSASFEEEVPSPAFAGKLSGAVMDGDGAADLSLGWRLERFCDAGGLGSLLRALPLSALAPLDAALPSLAFAFVTSRSLVEGGVVAFVSRRLERRCAGARFCVDCLA